MELTIKISEEEETNKIITLKNFIDEASIDGIEKTEINRGNQNDDQLGVGEILNSITLIIKAATKPLTELAKSLRDYVGTYRTTITITSPDGRETKIDKGRSLSAKELSLIIKALKE